MNFDLIVLNQTPGEVAALFDLGTRTPEFLRPRREAILQGYLKEKLGARVNQCGFYHDLGAFCQIEDRLGFNCAAYLALCCEESAFGCSPNHKKRHNYASWNAVDFKVWKVAAKFATPTDSILKVGEKISRLYLADGGKFAGPVTPGEFARNLRSAAWNQGSFQGWWLRKEAATIGAGPRTLNRMNCRYASNPQWSWNIAKIMCEVRDYYLKTEGRGGP